MMSFSLWVGSAHGETGGRGVSVTTRDKGGNNGVGGYARWLAANADDASTYAMTQPFQAPIAQVAALGCSACTYSTMWACFSSFSSEISLNVELGSPCSSNPNRSFFKAITSSVSRFRALYTTA